MGRSANVSAEDSPTSKPMWARRRTGTTRRTPCCSPAGPPG